PGTTAKLVVTPVVKSVKRNANTSLNPHWNVPYSSDAKMKLKLILLVSGTKSNSSFVALYNVPVTPCAFRTAVKSASPPQAVVPSDNVVEFGPGALLAFPVVNTTPLRKGKGEPFWSKYPNPFTEPK